MNRSMKMPRPSGKPYRAFFTRDSKTFRFDFVAESYALAYDHAAYCGRVDGYNFTGRVRRVDVTEYNDKQAGSFIEEGR